MTDTSSSHARRLAAGLALAALLPAVTACGNSDVAEPTAPTAATAFVVGARGNMPPARLDGEARAAVERAVDSQAMVSVIAVDGQPAVADSSWLRVTGANDVAREKSRQENRAKVETAVTGVRAEDEETDLLGALDLAAREVRSVEGAREIVVVDSGLSTTGPLDFTRPGMLDAEPADVVADLEAADTLPDLCGIRITVQGIGDTAEPQDPLGIAQRRHLLRIWEAVLGASCAADVTIVERQISGAPHDDVPDVTEVPLPEPVQCTATTIILTGGEVAFLPDSADFRDPAAARAVLTPVSQQLTGGGLTATVTGMTANVGPLRGQKTLGKQRAAAVMAELVALGVPGSSLEARGVGSDFAEYVPDGGPEGPLDPAAAAQNRKVVIALVKGAFDCR